MKCPKCNYIGFEQTGRCRNCGYDFALAGEAPAGAELPLRGGDAGPLADFDLADGRRPAPTPPGRRRASAEFDPHITPGSGGAADLPLFGDAGGDDLPIVPPSAAPRAVRRTPPARPRPRATPRAADAPTPLPLPDAEVPAPDPSMAYLAPGEDQGQAAGPVRRALAGLLDALLLVAADAVVVYFTLRICRLATSDVFLLPLAPLAAFLVLLNGGYLVLLTAAGGQTLGKMAFGLKVVGSDDRPLTVGRAVLRALAVLVGVLPAGLGLLPTFFGEGQRGLQDRVAGTRVVRVHAS